MQYFKVGTKVILRDLKGRTDTLATITKTETFRYQFDNAEQVRFSITGSRRTFSTHVDNYIAACEKNKYRFIVLLAR